MRQPWEVEPWPVFGGWRIAKTRWFFNRDGERDQEERFLSETVYQREEECRAAIASMVS